MQAKQHRAHIFTALSAGVRLARLVLSADSPLSLVTCSLESRP
jgi:hypothetical protein